MKQYFWLIQEPPSSYILALLKEIRVEFGPLVEKQKNPGLVQASTLNWILRRFEILIIVQR